MKIGKVGLPRRTLLEGEDEDRCKGERLLAIEEGALFPGLEISVSPELIGCEGPEPEPDPNSSPSEESEESPLNGAERIWLARCSVKYPHIITYAIPELSICKVIFYSLLNPNSQGPN